ncbi:ethanolamine utilization protein EutL [Sporosarcina luteola]|uniref:ethanolamine utilization microcompartment protein EutL n=1 Tax=Sporosarcina TaxID=1569 RepID=UPI001618633D|nr:MULTISPECIES: ethanolamine utilization microcompartment protein EutL [Sporosarcina]MBB4822967.1 ethanolamine utilization protein EutL [Sporosarcina luteola]MCG3087165.1 ethanolamine utilization microcompartment protein EutL [Sporosarcina cyprini]GKV56103.1 microcompartment protein EutL [Sporosarcina sp. NCCP-2222]
MKIYADILSMQVIPNVNEELAKKFNLKPYQRSIGLVTTTIDDVGYTAIDEATKKTDVEVVYAKSFYAGAAHASGPLSGEFLGVIAGQSPEEVKSGLDSIRITIENDAYFEAINGNPDHALYAHTVSSTGTFLAEMAGIPVGQSLAYLIAPPLEAIVGLDAALKAADVTLCEFFAPPSETNFGGGLLTGSQSSCQAATDAFREAIQNMARNPLGY